MEEKKRKIFIPTIIIAIAVIIGILLAMNLLGPKKINYAGSDKSFEQLVKNTAANTENKDTIYPQKGQIEESEIFIAKVLGEEKGMTLVEMRNRFAENDEVSVLSPNEYCYKKTNIYEIWNTDGERVQDAKLVQAKYLLKTDINLKEGDILRRHRQGRLN